jgi:1,4-dihydroxy-2-naphthoate octaprenyltransferase
MTGLFQASDPIIIFLEPNSKWLDVVTDLRKDANAPTIIAQMKFDDLVMSSTFTNEFWDYEHSIDTEAKVHKGSGVYKIWNEKLVSTFFLFFIIIITIIMMFESVISKLILLIITVTLSHPILSLT